MGVEGLGWHKALPIRGRIAAPRPVAARLRRGVGRAAVSTVAKFLFYLRLRTYPACHSDQCRVMNTVEYEFEDMSWRLNKYTEFN